MERLRETDIRINTKKNNKHVTRAERDEEGGEVVVLCVFLRGSVHFESSGDRLDVNLSLFTAPPIYLVTPPEASTTG